MDCARRGGIIRHDAVVWGLARAADYRGVEIHQDTEVMGFERAGDRVVAVQTPRGRVECGQVVSATAGWSSLVGRLVGLRLPITTHILQAFVTEPVKPFLDVVLVSSQLHVYVSQTDRGEFLIGAEIEPYTTYKSAGTLSFLEYSAAHALELLPQLERTKVLRTWTGLCDLSPDYSPILGKTEIDNFHVSTGWGTYGFKAAPIVGRDARRARRDREDPDLIAPFALERFHTDTLVSELAAAAVSHYRAGAMATVMPSSLEIAQAATLRPILDVADELGLEHDEVEPYGRYKAKVDLSVIDRLADRPGREADQRHRHHADARGRGEDDDVGLAHPGSRRPRPQAGPVPARGLARPGLRRQGRRGGRRLRAGRPDGGPEPPFHRRPARDHGREQPPRRAHRCAPPPRQRARASTRSRSRGAGAWT